MGRARIVDCDFPISLKGLSIVQQRESRDSMLHPHSSKSTSEKVLEARVREHVSIDSITADILHNLGITIIDTIIHHILLMHTNDAYYYNIITYGHNLAACYEMSGDLDDAAGLYEEGLKLRQVGCCVLCAVCCTLAHCTLIHSYTHTLPAHTANRSFSATGASKQRSQCR
jgi:hypothetical protein